MRPGGGRGPAARAPAVGALLGLLAFAACATSGPGPAGGGAAAEGTTSGYVYVPNQADATVSVIDAGTREVVETVDLQELGFPPDAKPHDVVGAPDGSAWYVSLINANAVVKLSPANEVLGVADFEVPGMLSMGPEGEVLWVGRSMSAVNPPQSVGRIDTREMTAERVEVLYPRPHALEAGSGGRWIHSASLAVNRIATIDDETGDVSSTEVEGPTHVIVQFAVSPDGERLVGTGQMSSELLVFDRTRLPELPLVTTVETGTWPWHPVFTPDGRFVVFGNKKDDSVTIVDAGSWEVAAVVEGEGLSQPHGAVATPDGRHVFVSNNNLDGAWRPEGWAPASEDDTPPGNVTVIDVVAGSVVAVVPVGRDPNGVGYRPAR